MENKSAFIKMYDIIAGSVYCVLLILLIIQRLATEGEQQIASSFLFILIIFGLLYLYGVNKALKNNYNEYESPKIRIIIIRAAILILCIFAAVKLISSYVSA